ncbi:MAG: hypothetical protein AABY22_29435 [Nanoarchaeota archaeon]
MEQNQAEKLILELKSKSQNLYCLCGNARLIGRRKCKTCHTKQSNETRKKKFTNKYPCASCEKCKNPIIKYRPNQRFCRICYHNQLKETGSQSIPKKEENWLFD